MTRTAARTDGPCSQRHVDDCPGIASSNRLINYIKAGIETQYKVTHAPWKKVLGFKFECTESTVTMSAMHTIETIGKTAPSAPGDASREV